MTAGSKPTFFANRGKVQPISLAIITVTHIVRLTTRATITVTDWFPNKRPSTSIIFAKQAKARAIPHIKDVASSFIITFQMSLNSTSPRDRARMTVTEDWEPEFPPVSINIGIKAVRMTWTARAVSKCVMIRPVKVALTMRIISHGILCLKSSRGEVRR